MTFAVVLAVAYIIGSIPTSCIVVYRFTGRDIRTIGSDNPGTMNVLDSVGVLPAVIVGIGDISKGMAVVAIAYLAGLGDMQAVAAALVAIVGHDYSVFLRLHGGNGTAAAVGGMAALLPIATFLAISLAVTIWFVNRSRRMAGLIGLGSVPVLAFWFEAPETKLIGVVLLIGVIVVKVYRFEGFSPEHARHDR